MDPGDAVEETLAQAQQLPAQAVATIFRRYGKPLAAAPPPAAPDDANVRLVLDDGATAMLRALEVRTPVDVLPNDWFILEVTGAETLAVPGPLFAAAVAALAQKLAR
jgi:hypothetical protein